MKLKRLSALALSAALALSVPALAEESTTPLTREESALQYATLAAQYGGATGVQYAVWVDGEITISGSTGVYSKTENRAMTDQDLYGIGSVSKTYTAAAVMQLVEAGKINLDAPVTKYLPTFKMADERYKQITVRMLLNHSSGLMGGTTNNAMLFGDDDQVATDTLLSSLSTQRLKADPGEIAVYCNDGFTLAELVVEAVSGQDFGAYLHEHILKDAGLDATFVPQDEFDTTRLVKTYMTADETRATAQDAMGIVGCGGLYASASDLAAFGGALTGTELLTAASTKAMVNAEYKNGIWPEDDADMLAYGLGWDTVKLYPFATSGIQALAKGGDTLYYHAGLVVIPEHNMAAAVLSSGGVSTYNEMAASQMLVEALADKGVTVDQTVPTLPAATPATMPTALADLSGYYGNLMQQYKITVADGKLVLHSMNFPDAPDQELGYYSDGTFRDATGQAAIVKLVTEKNGVTYLYQRSISPIPGLGYMPLSQYLAEKLEPQQLTDEVQSSWDQLNTLPLLPATMKYTSQLFAALFTSSGTSAPNAESIPGYMASVLIVDETTARSTLRIPGNLGRDSQDITVYEQDGVTFMTNNQGILFRDYSDMTALYAGSGSYTTVGQEGYARWYTLDPKDAGKTMTVTLPEGGGYYVYAADGSVVSSSAAYGETSCVLPEGGYAVFAGGPGARFSLSFAK